MLVVKGGSLLC